MSGQERFFQCGDHHVVGSTTNGDFYVWGSNLYGQLGLGHFQKQPEPQLLPCPDKYGWLSIHCGGHHTIGITREKNAFVWGDNNHGQLGLGDTNRRLSPVHLPTPHSSEWREFFCGSTFTIGITEDEEAFAWGKNHFGQLGVGDNTDRTSPTPILPSPSGAHWKHFYCGADFVIGIDVENKASFWGKKIGCSTADNSFPRPVPDTSDLEWKNISVGWNHAIGITTTGQAFCWGVNRCGQLGISSLVQHPSPVPLPSPSSSQWKSFSCGCSFSMGVTEDGNGYAWGINAVGELGLGAEFSRMNVKRPIPLPSPSGIPWEEFYCGTRHSLGVTRDGQVYSWGVGSSGQLGLGICLDNQDGPKLLPPPGKHYWGVRSREKINLESYLESGDFADIFQQVGTITIPLHSSLVSLRCPSLLSSPLHLSSSAALQLAKLCYGGVVDSSLPLETLLELHLFIKQEKLIDFEDLVSTAILSQMNSRTRMLNDNAQPNSFVPEEPIDQVEKDRDRVSSHLIQQAAECQHFPHSKEEKKDLEYYLRELLESGKGSDFLLLVEGTEFPVHRFVLSGRSSYFHALLQPHTLEAQKGRLDLSHLPLSLSTVKKIVELFYCGTWEDLQITNAIEILMVEDFLSLSDYLQFVQRCEYIINTSLKVDNCVEVMKIAHCWKQEELLLRAVEVAVADWNRVKDSKALHELDSQLLDMLYEKVKYTQ